MITKDEIIKRAKEIHGDKYDYSITESVKNKGCTIQYICPKHGIVTQILSNHLQGKGCSKCANESRRIKHTLPFDEFIKRASETHDDLDNYDWEEFDLTVRDEYNRTRFKCKKHGYFMMRPEHFMNGCKCQYCVGKIKNYEELKKKLSEIHPTLDFTNSVFYGSKDDYAVTYICPIHGEKKSRLYNLLHGEGCYECAMKKNSQNQMIKFDEFIERSSKVHDLSKYSFEKTDLLNRDENGKVIVTCLKHGDFKITPRNFMLGHGCRKCANELNSDRRRRDIEGILKQTKELYGDKYEYLDLDTYKTAKHTILHVKCNECGNIFETTIDNFLNLKNGCKYCSQSSIEQMVSQMLKENNIDFIYRAKKKIIPWIKSYELDFYLPKYNIGIECQGGQHFYSVPLWGGDENLEKTIKRDLDKQKLCENNNIKLLYFSKDKKFNYPYNVFTNIDDLKLEIIKNYE